MGVSLFAALALLMPAVLRAQATATAVALGSVNVGSTGTGTVTFTFSGSTTVASVSVVTQGVTGLDFTAGTQTTGACTATTYAASATCTVVVNFTPQAAGLRLGAVLLLDSSSNKLAVASVSGSGSGATFETDSTATTSLIATDYPANITIDASGNLYVTSSFAETAVKLTPAGVQTNIAGSAVYPGQVAVDGAGYIYIFDTYRDTLYRTDPVSGTQSSLVSGLSTGYGLAVDPQGNIYLGQGNSSTSGSILKYSPTGTLLTTISLAASPSAMLVDASGNLYYVAFGSGVYTIAAGGTTPTLVASVANSSGVASLARDAAGNLYCANQTATLYQIPAGGSTANAYITAASGFILGVGVDATGNLYYGNASLYKVDRTHPIATLSGTTAIGSTSTEKTQTYRNIGSAALAISTAVASANGKVGPSNTCSAANAVAINATCVASLEFAPVATGSPQSATLTLTGPLTAPVFTLTAYVSGDPAKLGFTSGPPLTILSGSNPGTVTVAIQDNSGTTVPAQTDSLTLTITGPSAPTPTTVSAVNGVATFNLSVDTLTTVGTYTFTVTDNTRSLTSAATTETVLPKYFTVVPGSLTTTASAQDSIVVTAYDNAGNQATAYAGYVALTSTDSAATLPAPFSLSSGQGTAGVTFNTVGMQTVTAKDSATGLITGTSASITVTADPIYTVSYATDPSGSGTAANCPNQNVASPPSTASCSLRDAFAAANALNFTGVSSASPIINFSSTLVAANPVLSIGSVITPTANFKLVGPGAASLTISPSAAGFSFINSTTASIAMTVSGLTISGFSRTNVSGGAWSANGSGHVSTFTNDVFTANSISSTGYGGAVYEAYSSAVILSGSTFTGNSAYNGGAVALQTVTQATIGTSTFGSTSSSAASQNTATSSGGSLYASSGSVTITGSTFSGNGTTTNAPYGGAAYVGNCTCTLTNNAFTSNTASYAGGALYVYSGTLGTTATPSSGNIFSANQVTNQANNNTNGGGAIFFYYTNLSALLTNSLFSGNTVAGAYATGGAIDIYSVAFKPNITITNSLFTGNKASASTNVAYGGAIYQSPGSSSTNISTLTLTGDTFTGNSANTSATSVNYGAYGGAVYPGNFVTDVFYNDTVTANQAKNTSGNTNAAVGGGIFSLCNPAQYCPALNNTIVAANTSLSDGLASIYPDLDNDNNSLANASCSSAVCNNASTAGGTSVDTGILLSALGNYGGTAIGPVGATVVPGSYAAANGQLILQSIVPLPGSAALAAGNTSYIYPTLTTAPYYSTCSGVKTATDNRGCGYPRSGIYNGTYVDAGATEPNYTLSFVTQPVNTAINTALLPPPTVQVFESGVPFGGTGGTLALTANAGTPSITSVATTANGLVSLAPTFTTPESDDALIVSVTNGSTTTVASTTSGLFNITDPTAKSIGFTAAPPPQLGTGGNAGTVKVALYNASGVIDTSATNTVTLAVTGTASASYGPTAAVAGVATFNLSGTALAAGSYTYTASSGYTTDTVVATETVGGANAWLLDANQTLVKLSSTGTLTTTVTGAGSTSATYGAIAFDQAGDVYSVNSAANSLLFTTNNGGTSANYTGGGLSAPVSLAVDGAGYVWIANSGNNTVSEFNNARTAVSPSSGIGASYVTGEALSAPSSIAIDQTGGVWVTNKSGNSVTHVFGAAAPTVAPISSATATGTLGTKP
jgi:sugar lactone lactonase YvrE